MSKKDTLQSLTRSIEVLKVFSPNESSFTLTELHKRLDISIPTLQRILTTLTTEGFLEKDNETKTYRLGLELFLLGNLVKSHSSLLSIAKEEMKVLNEKTQEGITLNIIKQNKRKCIGHIETKHELAMMTYISYESPIYAGASAKILLAYLPDKKRNEIINNLKLEKTTMYTVESKEKLLSQLEKIRSDGYAISLGERILGVFAISAPIRNRFGEVIAGVTLTIPSVRVKEKCKNQYIEWTLQCASTISNKLGFHTTV